MNTNERTTWGLRLLRYGLIAVFLYFGIAQLLNPADWTIWLPAWSSALPVSPETLIIMNGGAEVVLSLALLFGFYTRVAAALLALHMFAITLDIGFTEIGVRDFGLSVAMAAIAFFEPDSWTIDAKRSKKTKR